MSSFLSQCGHRARRAVSFNMQSGCGALGVALFAKASQTRNHMAVDEVGSVGAYPATMSIATNPVERPQTRPAEQPNVSNDRVVFAGA